MKRIATNDSYKNENGKISKIFWHFSQRIFWWIFTDDVVFIWSSVFFFFSGLASYLVEVQTEHIIDQNSQSFLLHFSNIGLCIQVNKRTKSNKCMVISAPNRMKIETKINKNKRYKLKMFRACYEWVKWSSMNCHDFCLPFPPSLPQPFSFIFMITCKYYLVPKTLQFLCCFLCCSQFHWDIKKLQGVRL